MLKRFCAPSSWRARVIAVLGALALQGCDINERLLSANDPDLIRPEQLETASGAEAVRIGALARWRLTTGGDNTNGNDNTWLFGGLLADEWGTSSTFVQNDQADQRRIQPDNSTVTFAFRKLHRVRTASNQALQLMRRYRPTERVNIAELYLARGFSEMQLASDFCNGIPLSNSATTSGEIEYGAPLSVDSVFKIAVVTLDSGLTELGAATDAQTVSMRRALSIAKARALLGLERFADAAAAVNGIPTSYVYEHTFAVSSGDNALWGQPSSGRRYLVGDSLEGNGRDILVRNAIPFFSAGDPRLPARYTVTVRNNRPDTTKSQDGLTNSRTTSKWARDTPVDVVSGLDARLIEAEARLRADDPAGMLAILNAVRAAPPRLGTVQPAAMAALTDPGTFGARTDLLFREKAFWTFGRGQRLGDLRRLMRQYQRTEETTFPEGPHYRGGSYGDDVNLPIPQEEANNPNAPGGCTNREP